MREKVESSEKGTDGKTGKRRKGERERKGRGDERREENGGEEGEGVTDRASDKCINSSENPAPNSCLLPITLPP